MKKFAIDNSAILYLALIRKHHTNIFRFTMILTEAIDPDLLQRAVNRVHRRFPSIFAGFQPGFFRYSQVPAEKAPELAPDPGALINMTRKEIARCAYRIYYSDKQIITEAFHGATDSYGMIASLATLTAEYLHLRYGIHIPADYPVFDLKEEPKEEEVEDSYLRYADGKSLHMPSRYAYQLPGMDPKCGPVCKETFVYPVEELLSRSRQYGVSITAFLSAVMASSIMELQHNRREKAMRPVRIMVPIDLRKLFPSKTLRNFILYTLPTMEVSEHGCNFQELAHSFSRQINGHLDRDTLRGIISYNVNMQRMPLFRIIPSALKCALMRLVYTYFGESNSSLTMTNFGRISLPESMNPYVQSIDFTMMPRVRSPYNCGMYSFKGNFHIHLCRFPVKSELEAIFRRNLQNALYCEDQSL